MDGQQSEWLVRAAKMENQIFFNHDAHYSSSWKHFVSFPRAQNLGTVRKKIVKNSSLKLFPMISFCSHNIRSKLKKRWFDDQTLIVDFIYYIDKWPV